MDKLFFERNLLALSIKDRPLCGKLSKASSTRGRYRFLESRQGLTIPAVVDISGSAKALHSMIDPDKEAQRLIANISGFNFLVLLGLGGGYTISAALQSVQVSGIIVIDYDIDGISELFASIDFVKLIGDAKLTFLIDPTETDIRRMLLERYHPALSGGITVLPLRARTEQHPQVFHQASETLRSAIDIIADDYSVQAYFGKRWFANTFRNLPLCDRPTAPIPPIRSAAVVAAGPSLDEQLPALKRGRRENYIIATDTALPALLVADMPPDAVIAIDCQHISYYHFMEGIPPEIPLFLDIAAPPSVAARSERLHFFSGEHPLTIYCTRHWKSLPMIDTSGGNVTYAAVSLASVLGAQRIELFGADFSYPNGNAYAKGTYIHPYFQRNQTRLNTLDTRFTSFVFRNESLIKIRADIGWRYETKPLSNYRQHLERLIPCLNAEIIQHPGSGAPIRIEQKTVRARSVLNVFAIGKTLIPVVRFIDEYRQSIAALPVLDCAFAEYWQMLNSAQKNILMTVLPTAAFIRRQAGPVSAGEVLYGVKAYCLNELDRILMSMR